MTNDPPAVTRDDPYSGLRPSQREHLAALLRTGDEAAASIADPVLREAIRAVTQPNLEAIFFASLHQENNTRMQIHAENLRLELKITENLKAHLSVLDRGLGVTSAIHEQLIEAQEALAERQEQALHNQTAQRESLDQLLARLARLEHATIGASPPGEPDDAPLIDQISETRRHSRYHTGMLWWLVVIEAVLIAAALSYWLWGDVGTLPGGAGGALLMWALLGGRLP